jgi:hypothetical protein
MRVNLSAQSTASEFHRYSSAPITITVRPSSGIPGTFSYTTDSSSFLRMLRQRTELASTVLERFEQTLNSSRSGRLLGVELGEKTLTEIGYFVD